MRRLALLLAPWALTRALAAEPHNVLLFVADGLRPGMVNERTAPAMASLLKQGVQFTNSHAIFPTAALPNEAAMLTGQLPGETGAFTDTAALAKDAGVNRFLQADPPPGGTEQRAASKYNVLELAAEVGLSAGAIGMPQLGPLAARAGAKPSAMLVVNDASGRPDGTALSPEVLTALKKAGLPALAPPHPVPVKSSDQRTSAPGVVNKAQQDWLADIATKVVLPLFRDRHRPFALIVWSANPGSTQRSQGDSQRRLIPGVNGPASLAAIRSADEVLARLLATLKALDLEATTDVVLASAQGASTISKESATSFSATQTYKDVPPMLLPPGFVAIDLAHGLETKLFDPDAKDAPVAEGSHPILGNGVVGDNSVHARVVVVANGGSDLIYLPAPDPALAAQIIHVLAGQDYTSGLFVNSGLGAIPGTLPLAALSLEGSSTAARLPSIIVNFRSFSVGCADPATCAAEVADTVQEQGQGTDGGFSRADTRNVMGAIGPDFRTGYIDPMPASNADLGRTMAALLGLDAPARDASVNDPAVGRVLTEAMPAGAMVGSRPLTLRSTPDEAGQSTVVRYQTVGRIRYFDAAGYPGRTLGSE